MKTKLLPTVFLATLLLFLLGILLLPKGTVSKTERRTLRQFPVPSLETVFSGDWAKKLDSWLPDQFPAREPLRRAAMRFRLSCLRLSDYNGVYEADGMLVKTVYPLDETAIARLDAKIDAIAETYAPNCPAYYAVVPDKGTYLAEKSGHLAANVADAERLLREHCAAASPIALTDLLTAADYYATDIHWRQERLLPVAERLLAGMGAPAAQPAYTREELSPFYGSYYAQSPAVKADTLTYLVGDTTAAAVVDNLQKPEQRAVYDLAAFSGMDGYDVFLSGATPFLTLTNGDPSPEAAGRTLLLFRDSFGSSIAPLLLPGYETIRMIDLRYMHPSLLPSLLGPLDEEKTDVLFLYGLETANTNGILR